MTILSAGQPLEPARFAVGRRTVPFVDHAREGRALTTDIWYPAAESTAARSLYEVLPGVTFQSAGALHDAPVHPGRFPMVLLSHGRTGARTSYSLVCEALAARGAVVVSSDHPGDVLLDWLSGRHADDRTNEVNRVADAHFLIDAMLAGHALVPADVRSAIDPGQVVLVGHSYGAYTAFATAAGSRGVAPHPLVRGVVGFQAYTRSMSDRLLERVTVPSLLVVSERDDVTPAAIDADRPWALLRGAPTWRLDLAGAGHQAISDISLYAELAHQVEGLPQLLRDYLAATAAGSQAAAGRDWRSVMALQVRAAWAFIQLALDLDTSQAAAEADKLAGTSGLSLLRR